MKNLIFIFLFLTFISLNAQEGLVTNDKYNFPPEDIGIDLSNSISDDAYNITLEWISSNFKSPAEVIKAQDCGKFLKLQYVESDLFPNNSYLMGKKYYDVKYDLLLSFSDNKINLEIKNVQAHYPETVTTGGWKDLQFSTKDVYLKNGEINKRLVNSISHLQNYFSDLVFKYKTELKNSNNAIVIADSQ